MTDALKPGPLTDPNLLSCGMYVRHCEGEVSQIAGFTPDGMSLLTNTGLSDDLTHFSYIGEDLGDGWISWSGGENPVGDAMVEIKCRGGYTMVCMASTISWTHPAWPANPKSGNGDIIVFRLSPSDQGVGAREGPTPYEATGDRSLWDSEIDEGPDPSSPEEGGAATLDEVIDTAWRDLGEVDDRTSPEEYPDTCLITFDELSEFMRRPFAALRPQTGSLGSSVASAPDTHPVAETAVVGPFQSRVLPWLMECFGAEIAADRVERCDRFVEEALELAQSLDWTADRAHALVDYVYGRPKGEPHQEVGGVMVTLAALCQAADLDMVAGGEDELARIMRPEIVTKIRAKQAAKPTGSALPVADARKGGEA